MKILVVEDNMFMREELVQMLRREGYAVDQAEDAASVLEKAPVHIYDAILLDVGLPDNDDFTLLQHLRTFYTGPVLVLTGKCDLPARVQGLDAGADDYLTKPFEREELLARMRAITRRENRRSPTTVVTLGDVLIDIASQRVFRQGQEVQLTRREFAILRFIVQRRGEIVSSETLHEAILDEESDTISNVLNVHIYNIRKKLGKELIETIRDRGYLIT